MIDLENIKLNSNFKTKYNSVFYWTKKNPVISSIMITFFLGIYFLKVDINKENINKIASNPKNWIYKKIAGLLLVIPGFFTDLVGILLLFNSLRFLVWGFIPEKTKNHFYDNVKSEKDRVIEADYRDLDD